MAPNTQEDVLTRLKKIEGQVRGLQKMIEERRDCSEIVTQLAAARHALDRVGFIILSHRLEECVKQRMEKGADAETSMEEAMKLFMTLA
jgi:CsoR family transcriptional regulator, copper-sensing transcriptional repressor